MRLVDALGGLPPRELDALAERFHVAFDRTKRLSQAEQVARGMAPHPSMATLDRWPHELRAGAERLAVEPHGLRRQDLGGAALRLLEARLAFPVRDDRGDDGEPLLAMPGALRLGFPPSPRDRTRSVRSLLALPLDDDVVHALAGTHSPRPLSGPVPLRLEPVLLHLEDPRWVATVLETLPADERRILDAVDARGGVLSIGEVLALEGTSARYATSQGAVLPRRSTAFELVRRGFLLPQGRDALVLPEEVGALVGQVRRQAAARARQRVLEETTVADLAPARTERGGDPGPATAALLLVLRALEVDLDARRGIAKTPLRRAARAAGVSFARAELLVSLARGGQLASAALPLAHLGRALFFGWVRGGAWDEARRPPDRFRAGERLGRVPTPTVGLRDAVVDLLADLPAGRFARREAVLRAALRDLRALAAPALLANARLEAGDAAFAATPDEILGTVLDESLPALGMLDVGDGGDDGRVLRPTSRLQAWAEEALGGEPGAPAADHPAAERGWRGLGRGGDAGEDPPSEVGGPFQLAVPGAAPLRRLLSLGPAVDPFVHDGALVLEVNRETLRRALDAGESPDVLLEALSAVAGEPPPDALPSLVEHLHAGRVPATWEPAVAFLRVADEALRASLLAEEPALFVADSPPGGVLVRPGVTRPRVRRALDRRGGRLVLPEPDPPGDDKARQSGGSRR